MFKTLKFKHKIALLPIVAMCGFLLVMLVVQVVSKRNEKLLTQIDNGFVPALELSRDMEELLSQIQRAMQDAVASTEESELQRADEFYTQFTYKLEEAVHNPMIEAEYLQALKHDFQEYYTLARSTSDLLINGSNLDEGMVQTLQDLNDRYNKIRVQLESHTSTMKKNVSLSFQNTQATYTLRLTQGAIRQTLPP